MLRVLYAGSPDASAMTLERLLKESESDSSYEIVGILTNPPSAQGRHKELVPTAVEQCARKWNEAHADQAKQIAIFTPEHLDSACREKIAEVSPALFVCFAYGHIFGPKFLASFKLGGINLHPSLLPRYRGCTPVNAAILNRDKVSGYSVQRISLATDEGDLLMQKEIALDGTETTETLLNRCAVEGAASLVVILREIAQKNELPPAVSQSGEPTYCPLIKKEDGKINWNNAAVQIDAQIRAYTPWPGCFTEANGIQLRILKGRALQQEGNASAAPGTVIAYDKAVGILIKCGEGVLAATELQFQAKKAMDYKSFMNGARDFVGTVLA